MSREIQMQVGRQGVTRGVSPEAASTGLLQPGRAPCGASETTLLHVRLRPRAGHAHARRPAPGSGRDRGAEPVRSQTGDDGWSPAQAGEGWRRPGRAARTHREGRGAGAQAPAPRETGALPHLTRGPPATWPCHPGHPSSIHPSSAGGSSSSPVLGLTSGETLPSEAAQPEPTSTLPSAKTQEEGTPDWLLAAAGLGSWDQAPKRHLRLQWGHCSARRHAWPQPEADNPHIPALLKSDST